MVCDVSKLNNKDADALLDVWERINQLTQYGPRREYAEKPSCALNWSNANARWFVQNRRVEAGTEVRYDAEDVLVPYSPFRMDRIVECLPKHPLYRRSLEGGAEFGLTAEQRIKEWAIRQRESITQDLIGNNPALDPNIAKKKKDLRDRGEI